MTSDFSRNPVRLAVTLGDPAGVGPEVALKALARRPRRAGEEILLIGRAPFYAALARRLKLRLSFCDLDDRSDRTSGGRAFPCFHPDHFSATVVRGRSVPRQTKLAVRSIEAAARLAMEGIVDGIVTPPINKAGLKQAGYALPGHTEYLAQLAGSKNVEMMLVGGPLRVVLVTRHVAIRNVPKLVTAKNIERTVETAVRELRVSFGIAKPKLVVCGLNPHAGEAGAIGREELKVIAPAVRRLRRRFARRASIDGPLSPDALFIDAYRGRWDAEICMYHDQGLIPLKMISRGGGVNVTLGLPFVRTSPDHGTAYDIANRFTADAGSFSEALDLAVRLVRNRRRAVRHKSEGGHIRARR